MGLRESLEFLRGLKPSNKSKTVTGRASLKALFYPRPVLIQKNQPPKKFRRN